MDVSSILLQIVAFLFALSVHEMAHAWAADHLGDPTARLQGRLTINPISHIDPIMTILFPALMIMAGWPAFGAARPVPVNTLNLANPKRDHCWIAAAGPISNFVLAAIAIVVLRGVRAGYLPLAMLPASIAEPLQLLLWVSVTVNLLLGTFNLIPIHPLDGSWILSRFLTGQAAATYASLRPYGFLLLILLLWTGTLRVVIVPVLVLGQMLVLL